MRVSSYTLVTQLFSDTQTLLVSGHCNNHDNDQDKTSQSTFHAKVFSGYHFSGDVINSFQMKKHECYNVEQGTSAHIINSTNTSETLFSFRGNDYKGVHAQ
ncbi:hypothetical protein AX774_g2536 [Zancudomyces culisetae]|uniref:Uncharacterized protein n=1 Tax=Zancudomyces culisetae TaxID=1213189 RepID=A0A1R1PSM1_ZANCU|nr:hypothetical protein AX774_g2536 [Zancudomyces culisetae]|eukprot:OMH83958.1 hypothetical protein AX774_g2536 [Zancudomyces culisetae]